MSAGYQIREVEPRDEPALAALERASPEGGSLTVRLEPRVGYLELAARYPGVRGYVAVESRGRRILGMLFSSIAPTQVNGAVVPGAYLFSLRVHPAVRQRGIGSALLAYAREQTRGAGAEVAWAGVMEGNQASLRTLARAGFDRTRDLVIALLPPAGRRPRPLPGLAIRTAAARDPPALATSLNEAHHAHNLWRPCSASGLAAQLTAAGHDLEDVLLAVNLPDRVLAAGAVFDLERVMRPHLLGHRSLPDGLNRTLARLFARVPLRPLMLRQRALSAAFPAAGRVLLGHLRPPLFAGPAVLAVPIDPRDPAWPLVAPHALLTRPLHVVVSGARRLDDSRPMVLT